MANIVYSLDSFLLSILCHSLFGSELEFYLFFGIDLGSPLPHLPSRRGVRSRSFFLKMKRHELCARIM